jgi:hypothetical protein
MRKGDERPFIAQLGCGHHAWGSLDWSAVMNQLVPKKDHAKRIGWLRVSVLLPFSGIISLTIYQGKNHELTQST